MLRARFLPHTVLIAAASASANPFDVPIDPTVSSIQVDLCILGACDTDTSPLSGFWSVDIDSIDVPTEITLFDADMQATQDLNHTISFGFLGGFNSTLVGLRILYATPGVPMGPEAVVADAYTFLNVPVLAAGALTYTSTGIVCTQLQNSGMLCNDTRNLANEGQQNADQVAGTATSQAGVVTLTSSGTVQRPLDPLNPGLGTITLTWDARGAVLAPEPIPGDLDGDGDVDLADYGTISGCLGGPVPTALPPGCHPTNFANADLDTGGTVDLADIGTFQSAFTGAP